MLSPDKSVSRLLDDDAANVFENRFTLMLSTGPVAEDESSSVVLSSEVPDV